LAYLLLDNNQLFPFADKSATKTIASPNHIYDIAFGDGKSSNEDFYISQTGITQLVHNNVISIDKSYYSNHIILPCKKVIFWGARNLLIYNPGKKNVKKTFDDRLLCAASFSDSFIFVGSFSSGLWRIRLNENLDMEYITKQGRVNCIQRIENNLFAIGTNEEGVQLIDSSGKIKQRYTNLPGRIQALAFNEPFLYAGTKEGLYSINLQTQTIKGYTSSNMLPFDEVTGLMISEAFIFFTGRNAAVSIPLQALSDYHSLLKINIDNVSVNNQPWQTSRLNQLSHNLNNFSFNISNYSYRASANSVYHYRVIKDGSKLILSDSTPSQLIQFSLEPGDYQLSIYAEDKLLHVRSNSLSVPININNPFYSTWWFLVLAFVLLAAFATLIATLLIRRIKARELQKRNLVLKVSDLEARALQGQMNPHFVFNAVNSVQDFILSNKADEARLFLSHFARLIRMVLEHNRKKNVTVDEEIQLLRLYVSIEEQRLKDNIDLDVDMPEDFDADNILLPSMLLQPLVENAIWHGLSKKEGTKNIQLSFEIQEELLKIVIEDNGKGIEQDKTKHVSVGMEIVKERIRLAYEEDPGFDFFSIENMSGNKGVSIKIILPLQTEY